MIGPAHEQTHPNLELLEGCTSLFGAELNYLPQFIGSEEANSLLEMLLSTVCWRQPIIQILGRAVQSPRLTAWHGDPEAVYRYSGLSNNPMPWTKELADLRRIIQIQLGHTFNSVLLNFYRDGNDSMGWHRDNEPELGDYPVIASISLGGARRFLLRHVRCKGLPTLVLRPAHGSLFVMSGKTQVCWRHAIPKTRQQVEPRLNLTFRNINSES